MIIGLGRPAGWPRCSNGARSTTIAASVRPGQNNQFEPVPAAALLRASFLLPWRVLAWGLPELHLADWRPTKDTLHLYAQIVGKVRLATTPPRNHWWNVPLYVDVRGLTTRRLHHHGTTFEITMDFVDHALVVRTADGRIRSFELGGGLPVPPSTPASARSCASWASTSRSGRSRSACP
jgi:hypothetical protein